MNRPALPFRPADTFPHPGTYAAIGVNGGDVGVQSPFQTGLDADPTFHPVTVVQDPRQRVDRMGGEWCFPTQEAVPEAGPEVSPIPPPADQPPDSLSRGERAFDLYEFHCVSPYCALSRLPRMSGRSRRASRPSM